MRSYAVARQRKAPPVRAGRGSFHLDTLRYRAHTLYTAAESVGAGVEISREARSDLPEQGQNGARSLVGAGWQTKGTKSVARGACERGPAPARLDPGGRRLPAQGDQGDHPFRASKSGPLAFPGQARHRVALASCPGHFCPFWDRTTPLRTSQSSPAARSGNCIF